MKGYIVLGIIVLIILSVEIFGIPYKTIINGSHTGVITSIETTGIIFKTITVYVKTDPMSSQEDKYCLIDKSLISELEKAQENKSKVTVYYDSYLVKGWKDCNNEDGGIIIGVKN